MQWPSAKHAYSNVTVVRQGSVREDIVFSTCGEAVAEHDISTKQSEAGVLWGQAARAGKARALHSLIWTGYESSTCDELEQQGISEALRYLWVIDVGLAKDPARHTRGS